MNKNYRIAIIIIFILTGCGFLYLHYNYHPRKNEKIHWTYKIKPDEQIPHFLCKANKIYTFTSKSGISSIIIDNKKHYLGENSFIIFFEKDTALDIDTYLDGIWFKRGYLEIWEGKKGFNYPRLIYLSVDKYSDTLFKVSKGMVYNIPEHRELFYLGQFKKGHKKFETLMKNNGGEYFRFWGNYEVKFRAAEVPFFIILKGEPWFENLTIKYGGGRNNGWQQTKTFPKAYYLKLGDVIKTPFYLDEGDQVEFIIEGGDESKILCSTNGVDWEEIYENYTADKTGYLRIKTINQSIINKISITHNKTWELNLQPGEYKKIKMLDDDLFMIYSETRFYVDGQILESGEYFTFAGYNNRYLEIKASVDPRPINIWVVSRKGY